LLKSNDALVKNHAFYCIGVELVLHICTNNYIFYLRDIVP